MTPEARFERVLDSFAWVEYFRGTEAGRIVAEELETTAVGTPLVVVAELRDKYVRERVPNWSRDLSFIKDISALLPEDEMIAIRAGETKNRMRSESRRDFGLIDAIVYETAKTVEAVLVTGDPHFRGAQGVRFIR